MKRLIIGLVSLTAMLIATSAIADEKQDSVKVTLSVMSIVDLNVVEDGVKVIPGPEDYAAATPTLVANNAVFTGIGFADRADALNVNIFTNAKSGADVYVHALGNPDHNKTLRVEDIGLTVMTEKTYVLNNLLEGANAVASTTVGTTVASWLKLDNEAQKLFGVTMSTKATRLWVLKIGIVNLARYTENLEGYEADLTFTLMPKV